MTLGQKRAVAAYTHIQAIEAAHAKESKERKDYASAAQKLPVLIRTAGLCQALHFLKSRDKDRDRDREESKDKEGSVFAKLLGHLAEQLQRIDTAIVSGDTLCDRARQAGLSQYLWMTREALAVAEWYARLAQSELEIPRGGGE